MSGVPNKEGVRQVLLITRTIESLKDEAHALMLEQKRIKLRLENINDKLGSLMSDRTKLMVAMDVDPSQYGNFGHEIRYANFLGMLATLDPVDSANKPE